MNTLLRGLQDRGLVTRPETVDTGRSRPTTLTPAGEDLLAQAVVRVEEVEALMVSGLDPQARRRLGEALDRCIDSFEGAKG